MSLAGKTVYFPVESLVGLGHFNRAGRIVREMAGAGADVTVASGTFVDEERFFAGARREAVPAHVFQTADGAGYSLGADGRRTIIPQFNAAAHEGARIAAHLRAMARVKPDALLSEFWPFDRPQFDAEMMAMLGATAPEAAGKPCVRVASVRDMLDRKESPGGETDSDGYAPRESWVTGTLNAHYDAVLVHGDPRFVKLEDTFGAVADIKVPVIYTGYVLADLPPRRAPDAATGALVVSCGSGVNAHDMVFSFLAAWRALQIRAAAGDAQAAFVTGRPVNIVCGPRFAQALYEEVEQWARVLQARGGMPVTVEHYRRDLTAMLATAAFSVSLAGYNTTLETLALGVPSILIPKYRMTEGRVAASDEQWSRLQRLQAAGMAAPARPETVNNSRQFADMIAREMTDQVLGPRRGAGLDFGGAARTVAALAALVKDKVSGPAAGPNKFDTVLRGRYVYGK